MKLDNLSEVSDLSDRIEMLDSIAVAVQKDDAAIKVTVEAYYGHVENIDLTCPAGKDIRRAFVDYLTYWRRDVEGRLKELGVEL